MTGACKNPTDVVPSLPPVDSATVLLFEDFDRENNGNAVLNWSDFKQWNVVAGCVDLHGNGFRDAQPGYGLYVDLDGSENCPRGDAHTFLESQTPISLGSGDYLLEYWLAGNHMVDAGDVVIVTLDNTYREEIKLGSRAPFQLYTRRIRVAEPTSAKLRFAHSRSDAQGILLDLVRLRRVP